MRAPGFWNKPKGIRAFFLFPLARIFAAATALRLKSGPFFDPGIPVICVGNLNVGGTGKTPVVISLIEELAARGQVPAVISRGYGGSEKKSVAVDIKTHLASDVGDEPLLLAAFAPTYVGPDRVASAKLAVAGGATVLIMDDGFQSPALRQSLSIVVVDAEVGFGNGCVIPAGPLREPVSTGLGRADLVLLIGEENAMSRCNDQWPELKTVEQSSAKLRPLQSGMDWSGLRASAFAGIARPEKFFKTLEALGVQLVARHGLDDHQPLSHSLLQRLMAEAKSLNARLVTTEKDAVRLPEKLRTEVLTLPVRLHFTDKRALDKHLTRLGL